MKCLCVLVHRWEGTRGEDHRFCLGNWAIRVQSAIQYACLELRRGAADNERSGRVAGGRGETMKNERRRGDAVILRVSQTSRSGRWVGAKQLVPLKAFYTALPTQGHPSLACIIPVLGNSFLHCREVFLTLLIVRKLPLQVSCGLPPCTPHFYHSAVLCDTDAHPLCLPDLCFPVGIPRDKAGCMGGSPSL